MSTQPLDVIPMWALYILTVVAMLGSMEAGYRLNRTLHRKAPDKSDEGLGGTVGASLGLLAFLLAFVVDFGSNINTERRHLVVDEANAIGTTYLRAGFLDEPYQTEAMIDLRNQLAHSSLVEKSCRHRYFDALWGKAASGKTETT